MGIVINEKVKERLKDTYLWRYMSLPKFLDLITTQTLYFATNTQLITGDPYEGTLPFFTDFLFNLDKECKTENSGLLETTPELKLFLKNIKTRDLSLKVEKIRNETFINCWHINDDENYLMWQSYAPESGAVAIVTDILALIDAINTDIEIKAEPIIYNSQEFNKNIANKNLENVQVLKQLIKLSSLYKKEFFKGENELRLIYQFGDTNRIKVKLDKLIKHVYLSPKSTEVERQIIINALKLIKNSGQFSVEDIEKIVSNSFISHTYKNSASTPKTTLGLISSSLEKNEQITDDEKSQIKNIFLLSLLLTDIPSHRLDKELKKAENINDNSTLQ